MDAPLIVSAEALAAALAEWAREPWLAVDTEFQREDTYHAKLCLVQIGVPGRAWIVDALAVPDLAPLWALLRQPAILKVLHAAGQDLEIFVQLSGDCPRPVFDTQLASALLGHGEQLGYAALVERFLGIKVDKSLARTDWTRRPLAPAALAYAAADVEHLAVIYPRLRAELEARGRLSWLEEDAALACDPARYRTDPESVWQRVKGLSRLPAAARGGVQRLACWREHEALARNRPRRWILDDEPLCALALAAPADADALARVPGLPPKFLQKHAAKMLELARGDGAPPPPLPFAEPLEGEEKARFKTVQAALREIAAREQVVPTLIANRDDLETLVRQGAGADIPLLRGWRRALAGEALLKLG